MGMSIKICAICGREAECVHHLVFGRGLRDLADQDGLYLDLCNRCHNMGTITERIHDNSSAESLSKMLGQAMWMLDQVADEERKEKLKEAFRARYGRSYL